jgi:uncharacterized membrane protein YfcA
MAATGICFAYFVRSLEVTDMMDWLIAFGVGALTGILSGFGVGGGSLLLVYLTGVAGMEQTVAQGINLLYFLPAAAAALPAHFKNGYIEKRTAFPAVVSGLVCAALSAWVATAMEVDTLRRLFGVFLLWVGIKELFGRTNKEED